MADCTDDTDDAPVDSWDDVIEDFEDLAATFRGQAARNRERQRQAGPVPPELEGSLPDRDFDPSVHLVVPYYSGNEQRPVPRRPNARPPIRSDAVTVTVDGSTATGFQPGVTYAVDCTVRNHGGLEASNATVELFVEHRTRDVTLDTNPTTGVVELYGNPVTGGGQVELSGYASHSPDHGVGVYSYWDQGNGLQTDNLIDYIFLPLSETRTFSYASHPGLDGYVDPPEDPSEFKIDVYDMGTLLEGSDRVGRPYDGDRAVRIAQGQTTEFMGEFDGRFTDSPTNVKKPLNLSNLVGADSTKQVGTTYTTIPPTDQTTVRFEYTPQAPESVGNRVMSVLYVRTYSRGHDELPADWGALDHTTSRFMGRWEGEWR